MTRWMLTLACTHKLVADDPALVGDAEHCPACGHLAEIIEVQRYRDGDV